MTQVADPNLAWIQTFTGKKFHLLNPQQDEIDIEDIAHALGKMCRFTGHCRTFYSVAEHSVHASRIDTINPLWALLHDTPEAYWGDMNRPLNNFTNAGPAYQKVEKNIMAAICKKYNLTVEEPDTVKRADNAMLFAEKEVLLWPVTWDQVWGDTSSAQGIKICGWSPSVATTEFLHRFYELTNQL